VPRTTPLPSAFRRIWLASGISALGDGAAVAALPLLAASLTRDAVMLAVVAAAGRLPWLVLGPLGGALVDRWDRRRTMWITDMARAALLVVAAVGVLAGVVGVPALIGLAVLLCVGQILFDTAAAAYLPELLNRDATALRSANARLTGTQNAASGFLGLPVGAFLFSVGRTIPLVADAVSFLSSAVLIRTVAATASPASPARQRRSLLVDVRDGAAYLFRDPLLLGLSLRPAFGNLAFGAGEAVFVLFAQERLHVGATSYGLILAAEAVGGVAGTALAVRLARWFGSGGAMTLTAAAAVCSQLAIGLSDSPVVAGIGMAVAGASVGAMIVLGSSVRQAIVPGELMGRVAATARLMSLGSAPLGSLLGGVLATAVGLRAPYLVGAAFLTVTTVISATMTTNRKIEAALSASAG
jgi:MFS family permease